MSNRHATAGRIGALTKWGNTTDRAAATAPARAAAASRWLREVRAEHPGIDDDLAQRMADARRKAHMTRIAQISAAKRRRGSAA